jgi:hypothetical protein
VIDPVIVSNATEPAVLLIPAAPTSSAPLSKKLKPAGAEPETESTVLERVSTTRPADDVALSVGVTIDPLGRRTGPGAPAISMMSFAAVSATLPVAVTDELSVIPPAVETMLRLVGSMVAAPC